MTRTRAVAGRLGNWGWHVVVNALAASPALPRPLRVSLLRRMGLELGDCAIAPRVFFGSRNIRVGDNVFLNQGVLLDGAGRIDLGDGVQLGLGVTIVTGSHEIGARNQRAGADRADSVSIGPGVWIGARAVILPGVNIGAGAIIGAGAVVTQDCLVDGVYVGVPARRARTLPPGPDGQG